MTHARTKPGPKPRDLDMTNRHAASRKRPVIAMHARCHRDKRRLLGLLGWWIGGAR